jgi:hypothetical protein
VLYNWLRKSEEAEKQRIKKNRKRGKSRSKEVEKQKSQEVRKEGKAKAARKKI